MEASASTVPASLIRVMVLLVTKTPAPTSVPSSQAVAAAAWFVPSVQPRPKRASGLLPALVRSVIQKSTALGWNPVVLIV